MSELAMIARCLICDAPFAGPKFVKIGLGLDVKNNRIAVFVEKLTRHLFEKHREVAEEVLLQAGEYQGALFMAKFQTEDPSLKEQLDFLRWKVHQTTLNTRLSDQQITGWVDAAYTEELKTLLDMGDLKTFKQKLVTMIQRVRDEFEEPNKYVPTTGVTVGKAS